MFSGQPLNSVHESLFGAIEDEDGEEEGDDEETCAIEEACDVEGADTEAGVLEGFEDGGEGVDVQEGAILLGGETQGIDDGSGVHQQLNTKGDEELEVAVFRGPGGDDEAPGHGMKADKDYQYW